MAISTASLDLGSLVGPAKEPEAPATDELAKVADKVVASGGDTSGFYCRDLLDDNGRAQAKAMAVQLLPGLIANPNTLADVGLQAVQAINEAADHLFHLFLSEDKVRIPELTDDTRALEAAVKGFRSKHGETTYDGHAAKYEGLKSKIMSFVGEKKDMLQMLISDAKGLEARMDSIVAGMIAKQAQLRRNVEICNELLTVNEDAIMKLILVTAVMEYLCEEATKAVNAFVIVPGEPDEHRKREEKDTLVQLSEQMAVRTSEFKQRLYVAWATSPQIRNIRVLNYGLGQRLALVINVTIPVFKLTVAQWAMMIEAQQGAEMTQAAADFNDDTLKAWAASSATAVPAMAKVLQAPSTSPETVLAIADSLVAQFTGFDEAYQQGVQQRAAVDAAIVKGTRIIAEAADGRSAGLADSMKELVATSPPVMELPEAPELPDEILANYAEAKEKIAV